MTDIRIRLNQINADSIATSVFASKSDVSTVQDNVTALDNNAWVNANDYATYNTLSGLVNTVQANLTSLVAAAPTTLDTLAEIAAALENDANIAVTLTTAIGSVQSNVTSLTSTAAANDYNTYTSLSANIDSVQANVYALTLDTVATNGNSTTQSIEVAGLLVNGTTDLTSNVVIRGMIDTVDRIQFNTSVNTDTTAGVFAWNADQGTLQFGLSDAASVHLGQDTFYYVKAGESLSRGNVVYASGAVGNSGHIEVSKFYANNAIDERYVVGVMADDVTSGEFGYATVIGTIRGIVADGSLVGETWNLGDVLYPSPTNPGAFTNIQPEAPNQAIPIAFITSNSSSNGSIAIRATAMGYHLGELHDVQTGTESDGDVLTWVSSNSRWEPAAVASDTSNAWVNANDYNTYTTVTGLINTVQDNVTSLTSTVDNLDANIYNTYNTLSGLIDTVQDNVGSGGTTSNVTIFTASDLFTVSTSNTFNLSRTINNARDIFVSLSGVTQYPGVGYTVSGNVLTISNTAPLKQGLEIEVRHLIGEAGTRGNSWQEVTTSSLLNSRSRVIVDTSSTAVTLTLPSSPLLGDEVRIIDGAGNASNNAITLFGNGSNIEAASSNVVVDVDRSAFTLVYYNAHQGWLFGEK